MNPHLAYIALSTSDPESLSTFFNDTLELTSRSISHPDGSLRLFAIGECCLCVVEQGHGFLDSPDRTGLDHIALNVSESDLLSVATSLALQATPIQTVAGNWKEVRVDRSATCGAAVRFCCNLDLQPATSNWVERIDHIGIASADTANEEAFFHNHLGCRIESRQTDYETQLAVENFVSDRYGIVQHQRAPQQVGGLRVLFLNVGDCELEVLSELDSNPPRLIDRHDSGNTRQDRSAIGRFVERRGPGLHHVALKVPDINGLLKHLNRRKYRLIDPVGRPGSRRALIGFVHPAELGGVLIHFVERDDV